MKTLNQKKNFVQREVRLTDTKLFCSVTRFGNTNEIDIPFENIDGEKVSYKTTNLYFLLLAIGCGVTAIITLTSSFKVTETKYLIAGIGFILALSFFYIVLVLPCRFLANKAQRWQQHPDTQKNTEWKNCHPFYQWNHRNTQQLSKRELCNNWWKSGLWKSAQQFQMAEIHQGHFKRRIR